MVLQCRLFLYLLQEKGNGPSFEQTRIFFVLNLVEIN